MTEAEIDKGMRLLARDAGIILPALAFLFRLAEEAAEHATRETDIAADMSKRN